MQMEYGDEHRIFLQGIMVAGILKGNEMWELIDVALKRIGYMLPDDKMAKHRYLKDFVKCINEEIERINLKVENISDEESKRKSNLMILVNRNSSYGMNAMVSYTKVEIDYLKIVVQNIMESDDKEISLIYALNRVNELQGKRFSQGDAEDFLNRLYKDHWIRYTAGNDGIKLSPRFVKEMEPYLKDVYEDYIGECVACQKFVMKSINCENCDGKYHWYCTTMMADRSNDNVARCHKCNTALPENFTQNRPTSPSNDRLPIGFGNHFLNPGSSQVEVQEWSNGTFKAPNPFYVPESRSGEKRRRVERGMESDSDDSE